MFSGVLSLLLLFSFSNLCGTEEHWVAKLQMRSRRAGCEWGLHLPITFRREPLQAGWQKRLRGLVGRNLTAGNKSSTLAANHPWTRPARHLFASSSDSSSSSRSEEEGRQPMRDNFARVKILHLQGEAKCWRGNRPPDPIKDSGLEEPTAH